MSNWALELGFDHRFCTVGFRLHKEGQDDVVFYVPLKAMIEQLKVEPYELSALMQEAYQWTEGMKDIDGARVRLLEETNFQNCDVLDLSGYNGFAAEIAIKNGAKTAKVVDSEQWRIYGWQEPPPIDGVEFIKSDLFDWCEPADVVIWYNCLYHLTDPMGALNHVRKLTKKEMLLCTLFRYHSGSWVYVYSPRECNSSDPSVYFGPSLEALEKMLSLTGWTFERYAVSYDRCLYRCKPIPDFVDAETQAAKEMMTV